VAGSDVRTGRIGAVPSAYYLPAELRSAVDRLQAHGIRIEHLNQPSTLELEEFHIESNQVVAQAFEGHEERTISGKYEPVQRTLPAGTYRVPMNQPLARLAFYLIEARSNDGLLTWNVLDEALKDSHVYPIFGPVAKRIVRAFRLPPKLGGVAAHQENIAKPLSWRGRVFPGVSISLLEPPRLRRLGTGSFSLMAQHPS